MRQFISSCVLLATFAAASSPAVARAAPPVVVEAEVESVFVPNGFDDTDNVEVMLYGEFTDTCLRVDQAVARADVARRRIDVRVTALRHGGDCIAIIAPFLLSARVGLLPAGEYDVHVNGSATAHRRFTVARSPSVATDNFLYAPVSEASIQRDASGRQLLHLAGVFPALEGACIVIDDLRVFADPQDVLVVLPITHVRLGRDCIGVSQSFRFTQPLPAPFPGPGMMHVRVLNGGSYNRYVRDGETR